MNNCWPVHDVCALLFFNVCVSSASCTSVPLCLLPAEMSGWSRLLVQRAPPAANEVNLHVHAPRLAMCLHAFCTWGRVSVLCLSIEPVSVVPVAGANAAVSICSHSRWRDLPRHLQRFLSHGFQQPREAETPQCRPQNVMQTPPARQAHRNMQQVSNSQVFPPLAPCHMFRS